MRLSCLFAYHKYICSHISRFIVNHQECLDQHHFFNESCLSILWAMRTCVWHHAFLCWCQPTSVDKFEISSQYNNRDGHSKSTMRCQHLMVSDEDGMSARISTISLMLGSSIVQIIEYSQLSQLSKTKIPVYSLALNEFGFLRKKMKQLFLPNLDPNKINDSSKGSKDSKCIYFAVIYKYKDMVKETLIKTFLIAGVSTVSSQKVVIRHMFCQLLPQNMSSKFEYILKLFHQSPQFVT